MSVRGFSTIFWKRNRNSHLTFLLRFKENDVLKYVEAANGLKQLEKNTLSVTFTDIIVSDTRLSGLIQDEFYRWVLS